ncbi:hypothetical protein HZS_3625, partial [Henneguya salminicola]
MSFLCDFLIIGSGISASSCADELLGLINTDKTVIMVSPCSNVKIAHSLVRIGRVLDELVLSEISNNLIFKKYGNFTFISETAISINDIEKSVTTKTGQVIIFKRLIICTGSYPKTLFNNNPLVYTLRDLESVEQFKQKLKQSKSACVVGNGGIALELIFEITRCKIYWVIKQNYIGSHFFDEETSLFFEQIKHLISYKKKSEIHSYIKEDVSKQIGCNKDDIAFGSAVGPEWNRSFILEGNEDILPSYPENVTIFFDDKIFSIVSEDDKLNVTTTKGQTFTCDFLICAIGVVPNTDLTKTTTNKIILNQENAIMVDDNMRTSVKDIYAAGDCVSLNILPDDSSHPNLWFQMNLWTQAKHMGAYAARCAIEYQTMLPIQFYLFGHVTRFFGFKVCMLGLYNGQGFEKTKLTPYVRSNLTEFIRIVLYQGRIIGAILVGDTNMEETIENLILSAIDVSFLGENILNPDIDI